MLPWSCWSQVVQGLEQADLVDMSQDTVEGLEQDGLQSPFQPTPFYDAMIWKDTAYSKLK